MNLEEAIKNIYNIMFSPEKNISVFSSQTGQTLTETIEYLHSSEELTEDEENNGVKFNYNLNFTLIPMGERYRQYCNNVFKTDLDFNTKVFHVFLYPYYLESFVNASFAVLSTDGIQVMSDYIHSSLEIGHNQFVNMYCLRNRVETLDRQNEFILKEVEKAVDLYYKDIELLEEFNFIDLSAEFLGWSDNFPTRLINYVSSLDSYNNRVLGLTDMENKIKIENDLLDIANNASIFTAELKRV